MPIAVVTLLKASHYPRPARATATNERAPKHHGSGVWSCFASYNRLLESRSEHERLSENFKKGPDETRVKAHDLIPWFEHLNAIVGNILGTGMFTGD